MKIRSYMAIASAVVLAALTGCASLPSPEAMKAEVASFQLPRIPEAEKAMVYVVRPHRLGRIIRFNVFVDDQEPASEMGYTRGKQYIYFQVVPGDHKIYSKAENWAEVQISAKAGEVIFIEQDPSMGGFMARNDIAKIDEVPGKYHVKNLELGTLIKLDK